MNTISHTAKLVVLIGTLLTGLWACSDSSDKYTEGTHYKNYDHSIEDQFDVLPALDGANVIEFFSYGCIHCKQFAPKLKAWQKKTKYSSVAYIPAIWDEETELYAKIFYIVQAAPNFESVHSGLFELVGGFSRTDSLDDKKVALIAYLHKQGIQPIDVVNALTENTMQAQAAASVMLAKRFEVAGTPTIIVNGFQKIDNRAIQSHDELLDVISELVSKKS